MPTLCRWEHIFGATNMPCCTGLLRPSIYNYRSWVLQNKFFFQCLVGEQMDETSLPLMPLNDLADRHYGVIPSLAATYLDSARVCLDRHHEPPVQMTIKWESREQKALVKWD